MSEFVCTNLMDHAYRVELNRPDCGNLVTTEMVSALSDAVKRLLDDAKLLVLTGRGADFCKGWDYQAAPENAGGGRPPSALALRSRMAGPIIGFYDSRRSWNRGRADFAASIIAGVLSSR